MTAAISQWDAFMIETLLKKGLSREELVKQLRQENADYLNSMDSTFDYVDLITSAKKDSTVLEQAVLEGYTVKFLTLRGLKKLLSLKFNAEESRDYTIRHNCFEHVKLSGAEVSRLTALLAPNWRISEHGQGVSIVPAASRD